MIKVKTVVEHNETEFAQHLISGVKRANRLLLEDIHREANKTTPYKDGDLRQLVTKRVIGNAGVITWTVPYAQYQERGMRKDGTHIVRNYTTPGTNKRFAKKAAYKVMRDVPKIKRYLGIVGPTAAT